MSVDILFKLQSNYQNLYDHDNNYGDDVVVKESRSQSSSSMKMRADLTTDLTRLNGEMDGLSQHLNKLKHHIDRYVSDYTDPEIVRSIQDSMARYRNAYKKTCDEFLLFKKNQSRYISNKTVHDRIFAPHLGLLKKKLEDSYALFLQHLDFYKNVRKKHAHRLANIFTSSSSLNDTKQTTEEEEEDPQRVMFQRMTLNFKLQEIEEQHYEILKLETSLESLAELFSDMAVMTESQGTLLNDIENHVVRTEMDIEQGGVQLVEAKKHQAAMRKKMCCLIVCLGICLLFVILFFLSAVKQLWIF